MAIVQGWAWNPRNAHEVKAHIVSTGLAVRPATSERPHEFSIGFARVGAVSKRLDIVLNQREVEMLVLHMQAFVASREST